MKFSILEKRTGWALTWLGKLVALLLLTSAINVLLQNLHPFLAPNSPPHNGLFVLEGWLPDYAIIETLKIYQSGNYDKIITTGTPINIGSSLIKWKSYSHMTTARLIKMKIEPSLILTAVGHNVRRDRTYASAIAMKEVLISGGINQTNIHLISLGPHGRRSRLLFNKVLGNSYSVGITSLADHSYDIDRWWSSSNGFRSVMNELIAYLYIKFLFNP